MASDLSEDALLNLAPLGVVGAGLCPGVSDKPDLPMNSLRDHYTLHSKTKQKQTKRDTNMKI